MSIAVTCTPSISEESGDPIIWVAYRVSAARDTKWVATIKYTNDMGPFADELSGTGPTSKRYKAYGLAEGQTDPECRASIKAR